MSTLGSDMKIKIVKKSEQQREWVKQLKGSYFLEKHKGKLLHAKKGEKSLPRHKSVLKRLQGKICIKNLSHKTLTDAQIRFTSRGLKYITVNKSNRNKIR